MLAVDPLDVVARVSLLFPVGIWSIQLRTAKVPPLLAHTL